MSLWVAVLCGLAAAVAYGVASAVQHAEAHDAGPADTRSGIERLVGLLGNTRWWLSIGGDGAGLALQIVALATGPVVLIQPLLVLSLAVALPVGWALGGPRPDLGSAGAGVLVIGALGVFLVLVGDPGPSGALALRAAVVLVVAAPLLGAVVLLAVRARGDRVRAVSYGAVAGSGFGLVGVLVNALATAVTEDGFAVLADARGWLPLAGVIGIGGAAVVLTQVSFQIGDLGASLPANEAAAPLVAVVLGAALLGEHVPVSLPRVAGYLMCLAAIVAGTARLARPSGTPAQ